MAFFYSIKYSFIYSPIVVLYFTHSILFGHGFGATTVVKLADGSWQQIGTICHRSLQEKVVIASYDTTACACSNAIVKNCGQSKTNYCIRFGFEERFKEAIHHNEVICAPTQEFYLSSKQCWIPAYRINVGDELLCDGGLLKPVAYITQIKKQLKVYTLEIGKFHTFFVSFNSVLTHKTIAAIKDHVFYREHIKHMDIARFDADYDMAKAWNRLVNNNFVYADLEFLRHELAELILMGVEAIPYDSVHKIVDRFFKWVDQLEGY